VSVDDLGPGIDFDEFRRQVATMPSIPEISTTLEAALGTDRASLSLTDQSLLSPKSVLSQGLSQADSGFGSPPFFVADDDGHESVGDVEPIEDNVSGIEPLDNSLDEESLYPPADTVDDGKSMACMDVLAVWHELLVTLLLH